jgi:hypothetical protein
MKNTLLQPYTPEELSSKYDDFIALIEKTFSGERAERLKVLYNEENFGQELILAPASGKLNFHNCYVGGYIDHINNVIDNSLKAMKFYEFAGGTVDFTEEELIFSAMHHDLGKLGDKTGPYYITQDSQWHQEKRNEYFTNNTKIQWMSPPDRAICLLSEFGISINWKEMLAIKLSDGLYDDGNSFYLKTYGPDKELKTNLPYVIHMGDFISCRAEHDTFMREHGDLINY